MPTPQLTDPATSRWTVLAEPLGDVLADLDPTDLLLATRIHASACDQPRARQICSIIP